MFADNTAGASAGTGDPSGSSSGIQNASLPLLVPEETRTQFPDIIDLITRSESMSDADRQYWINILPIMTPEQLKNLRDILENERKQLAAIDAKYSKAIDHMGDAEMVKQIDQKRKKRSTERSEAESKAKEEEDAKTQELLKGIDEA